MLKEAVIRQYLEVITLSWIASQDISHAINSGFIGLVHFSFSTVIEGQNLVKSTWCVEPFRMFDSVLSIIA